MRLQIFVGSADPQPTKTPRDQAWRIRTIWRRLRIASIGSIRQISVLDERAEKFSNFRCVPLGGSDDPADFLSTAIDEQRRWQAKRMRLSKHLAGGVNVHREIADADLVVEFSDCLHSPAVDGDRNHFKIRTAQARL